MTENLRGYFDALLPALDAHVDARIDAALKRTSTERWTPHHRSPLGTRKTAALCREGAFPGARKVGRRWLIPTTELDAWILQHGAPRLRKGPPENDGREEQWSVDALARSIGLASTGTAA